MDSERASATDSSWRMSTPQWAESHGRERQHHPGVRGRRPGPTNVPRSRSAASERRARRCARAAGRSRSVLAMVKPVASTRSIDPPGTSRNASSAPANRGPVGSISPAARATTSPRQLRIGTSRKKQRAAPDWTGDETVGRPRGQRRLHVASAGGASTGPVRDGRFAPQHRAGAVDEQHVLDEAQRGGRPRAARGGRAAGRGPPGSPAGDAGTPWSPSMSLCTR